MVGVVATRLLAVVHPGGSYTGVVFCRLTLPVGTADLFDQYRLG